MKFRHLLLSWTTVMLCRFAFAIDSPAPKTQIDVIAQQGAKINSALCSTLETSLPDYRSIVAALRDDLLDESVQAPAAAPAAYRAADQLCGLWITMLQEREKHLASKGLKTPPSTDLQHGKKQRLSPADYVELLREKGNEKLHVESDRGTDVFFDGAMKKEWSDICVQNGQKLDAQFRRFRALRRQTLRPLSPEK